jgi:hypothetical protein
MHFRDWSATSTDERDDTIHDLLSFSFSLFITLDNRCCCYRTQISLTTSRMTPGKMDTKLISIIMMVTQVREVSEWIVVNDVGHSHKKKMTQFETKKTHGATTFFTPATTTKSVHKKWSQRRCAKNTTHTLFGCAGERRSPGGDGVDDGDGLDGTPRVVVVLPAICLLPHWPCSSSSSATDLSDIADRG